MRYRRMCKDAELGTWKCSWLVLTFHRRIRFVGLRKSVITSVRTADVRFGFEPDTSRVLRCEFIAMQRAEFAVQQWCDATEAK
jgi:hypothetical protein